MPMLTVMLAPTSSSTFAMPTSAMTANFAPGYSMRRRPQAFR
ncbi:hypothetical protein PF003_g13634 [Phytophthora fragariae]|nr:hypothetical protein PF003_g13634 [Phytophthora fragariae]